MTTKVTVMVSVRRSPQITKLVLEPWAGEYTLPSQGTLDVELRGDPQKPISIEVVNQAIVIGTFDSEGAEGRVLRDGVELRSE